MLSRGILSRGSALPNMARTMQRLNWVRYKSIDEFNKNKTEFDFGPQVTNFTHGNKESPLNADFQTGPALENHPSLQNLRPNLPDYKQQLAVLQQQFQKEKERERAKWEYMERMKGLGAGALALVAIISTYLLVMNYKYLKAYLRSFWAYDIDASKVSDMNDPKTNTKAVANLVERLTAEADPAFLLTLKDSRSVPGLYLFGAFSGKKLPQRVPAFDGKYLSDVLLTDDYLVAVDDAGRVYHYGQKFKEPVEVLMPGKIRHVVASGGRFYYVGQNGRDLYYGDRVAANLRQDKRWFGSSVAYHTDKVKLDEFARGEKISAADSGANHVLLLTSQGRLFGINSAAHPENKGQYGLPKYSGLGPREQIPENVALELTNLNNEMVSLETGAKKLKPRTFSAIACSKYANAAVESNGNVWTWGDNSLCQCGRAITITEESQPVPKMVYSLKDLSRILKYSLGDLGQNGSFSVAGIYAANKTIYLKMLYRSESNPKLNQDLLLSFGEGLRGQLGVSRYVHMSHVPMVIKSLVGMQEYDESTGKTGNIGIKSVVGGGDHVFITLDNAGGQKEVMVFGDNLEGQFGNGRTVKSAKPSQIPKLLEPADFDSSAKTLALRVNDQTKNRLQLSDGDIKGIEQVVAAGDRSSAIFYRRKR